MQPALQELPKSVAAVGSDAKVLDATNNRLREVRYLESLIHLQRLILARNQISELPASVCSLQSLKARPAAGAASLMTHPTLARQTLCTVAALLLAGAPIGVIAQYQGEPTLL